MAKKRTEKEFINLLNQKQDNQYQLLNHYVNNTTKVKVKCKKCGLIWVTTPKTLLRFRVGKNCNHHIKFSEKQIKEMIKKVSNNKFTMLGNYKGAKIKTLFRCNKCGYEWETQPYSIYKIKIDCPYETHQVKHDDNWVDTQLVLIKGIAYLRMGHYIDLKTPILFRHNKCGKVFKMSPKNIIYNDQQCPYERAKRVAKSNMINIDIVKKRIQKMVGNEYQIADDKTYSGINNKCLMKHECGYVWWVTPYHIYAGDDGCPVCNESRGENAIRRYLLKKHIRFKSQYRIKECKDKRALPFDFAVFNPDNSLNSVIEYQGIQHYKSDSHFYSIDTVTHDLIKKNYCYSNCIPLIEIKYPKSRNKKAIITKVNSVLNKELHVNPVPSTSES